MRTSFFQSRRRNTQQNGLPQNLNGATGQMHNGMDMSGIMNGNINMGLPQNQSMQQTGVNLGLLSEFDGNTGTSMGVTAPVIHQEIPVTPVTQNSNAFNVISPSRMTGMMGRVFGRRRKESLLVENMEPVHIQPQLNHNAILQSQQLQQQQLQQQQLLQRRLRREQQRFQHRGFQRQRQPSQTSLGISSPVEMRQPNPLLQNQSSMDDFESISMGSFQENISQMSHEDMSRQPSISLHNGHISPIDTTGTHGDLMSMMNTPFTPIVNSPMTSDAFSPMTPSQITRPFDNNGISFFGINFTGSSSNFGDVTGNQGQRSNNMMNSFNMPQQPVTPATPFDPEFMSFDINNINNYVFSNNESSNFNNDNQFTRFNNHNNDNNNNIDNGNQLHQPRQQFNLDGMDLENSGFYISQNDTPILSQPSGPPLQQPVQPQQPVVTQQQQVPIKVENPNCFNINIWSPKTAKVPAQPMKPSTAATQLSTGQSLGSDVVKIEQMDSQSEVSRKQSTVSMMDTDSKPIAAAATTPGAVKSKPPTKTREQIPHDVWEAHKGLIKRLYLDERKPLKDVMVIMAEEHNFKATSKMYKTRFSTWGFAKNNTEGEMKMMVSLKQQREAEGKTTEFVRNGKVVNMRTYLKRKGKTEMDLLNCIPQNVDLPGHTRCRTPPPLPNLPGHMAADLKRVQEVITSNMRKALLLCKPNGSQTSDGSPIEITWTSCMLWGAASSDYLYEADQFFRASNIERGTQSLNNSFGFLERDLKHMTPILIKELLFSLINKEPAVVSEICRFLGSWTGKNLERSHPLRPILSALQTIHQDHGAKTLSDLLWTTMPSFFDDLEAVYGIQHPHVVRTLIDLLDLAEQIYIKNQQQHQQQQQSAQFPPTRPDRDQTHQEYCQRVNDLINPLYGILKKLEETEGIHCANVVALRYLLLQMCHAVAPDSPATRLVAQQLLTEMREGKRVFGILYASPDLVCYHEPIKATPSIRRCQPRYDFMAHLLQKYENVVIQWYFEEDMHTSNHVETGQCSGHESSDGGLMDFAGDFDNFVDYGPNAALAVAQQYGGYGGGYMWG